MAHERPQDLFDRDNEWAALVDFARQTTPGIRIGIVSGRRRQGKSYLLRRITRASRGLYHQAQEVERAQALERFAGDVAQTLGLPREQLRVGDWETGLRTALGYPERGRADSRANAPSGPSRILVLDELPYLLGHSPEIPSVIQELYDESRDAGYPSAAIIVCGSALSVMSELLSGAKPLRGRAQIDMTIRPFDYLAAARYWGIEDPDMAFLVHAVFGGTAGYKPLVQVPPPELEADLPRWLAANVLNPAHALFNEKDYLLREDSRVTDKHLYNSILSSIAFGNHASKDIGAPLGRDSNHLRHPLSMLVSTGFLDRVEDVLTARRPLYFLADPIVRFTEIVIDPYRPMLEEGDAESAWSQAASSYGAQVLGPHFERIARSWTRQYSGDRWGGEQVGEVGPAVVNDPGGRSHHEVDVVALARGDRRGQAGARVVMLGEAKATNQKRGLPDLHRLERIRDLLARRGTDAAGAHLAIFSRHGFTEELGVEGRRSDVHLIGLDELYGR